MVPRVETRGAAPEFYDYGLTFVPPVELGDWSRVALVVVDMQHHDADATRGYALALDRISPGSCDWFNERNETLVIPAIRRLLDGCRERRIHVVYLCLGSAYEDYRDFTPRRRAWVQEIERRSGLKNIFWRGNPDYAILEELAAQPSDSIVHKTTSGAFCSSDFRQLIRNMGLETLIITGVSTNDCVESTARDAADLGYGVVIVGEATADYDPLAQEATLRAFHMNFGRVVTTADEMLRALDGRQPI